MVLYKGVIFIRFYFILCLFTLSHFSHGEFYSDTLGGHRKIPPSSSFVAKDAHRIGPVKSMIVQEIMNKVSNISLNALHNAPPHKKEFILRKIENKLRKSARAMGPEANKYIKYIMDEFKTKAVTKESQKSVSTALRKTTDIKSVKKVPTRTAMNSQTKEEIIKDISNKIEMLAKGFIQNAKTLDSKKQILEKIKRRIMDSAKQKHIQLHSKHEELKTYSNLIAQGLEVSMKKLLAEKANSRRSKTSPEKEIVEQIANEQSKVQHAEEQNKVQHAYEQSKVQHTDETKSDTKLMDAEEKMMQMEEIHKYKELIASSLNDTSIDPRCNEIIEETCLSIQSINRIACGKGKSIPIENLCNDVFDCVDHVDEVNCTAQAMDKVRKAIAVMSEVDTPLNRKCFSVTKLGDILSAQNQILRDILNTQAKFLEKNVKTPSQATETEDPALELNIKRTVADVTATLNSLSYALDESLCAHSLDLNSPGNTAARRFNTFDMVEEFEDIPTYSDWTPKSCSCKGPFCKDEMCESPCKRVCWQKHSLNRWECQAINGDTSVPLNLVCDGKLDCFDESDETLCTLDSSLSKFEAVKTYSYLLDFIATKSKSDDFGIPSVRNKFVVLHGLVRQLQKHTTKTNIDIHAIKLLRDDTFIMLTAIYEAYAQIASLHELDDLYGVLEIINEKLVTALKRSHTGNEVLISSQGCYCRDGVCVLRRCNKNCIQACLAEPLLTRYPCNNAENTTVPIESICNGRENCPNGEDEKNCIKGVCRAHHLVVLRHKLLSVGDKHQNSIMGEVLKSWREKVSASLFIAETAERPNHKTILEIISRVLDDLVMAFAAMEDYRRTNSEYALKEFIAVSRIVMETLKSCSN